MVEFNPKELREAFSSYITGVTIVTTKSKDGRYIGFTANSFTSVSLEPPLLLVCPGSHLSSFEDFQNAGHFAVNVLAENQEALSNRFASSAEDRFIGSDWSEDEFGSPVFKGVAAHFSCNAFKCVDAGDHVILVGQVQYFKCIPVKGLGYANSGYFSLGPKQKANEDSDKSILFFAGAVIECDGHVLVNPSETGFELPCIKLTDRYRAALALSEHLKKRGIEADIGQTYSVFHDPKNGCHYTYFRATARSLQPSLAGNFVKISQLDPAHFGQSGSTSMIRRFKSEIANQQFGLFIGNSVSGDVHAAPDS
jgi:flavin reductase (DIM6/NTAB) family NADH-FMN oxidoreductase RutF